MYYIVWAGKTKQSERTANVRSLTRNMYYLSRHSVRQWPPFRHDIIWFWLSETTLFLVVRSCTANKIHTYYALIYPLMGIWLPARRVRQLRHTHERTQKIKSFLSVAGATTTATTSVPMTASQATVCLCMRACVSVCISRVSCITLPLFCRAFCFARFPRTDFNHFNGEHAIMQMQLIRACTTQSCKRV